MLGEDVAVGGERGKDVWVQEGGAAVDWSVGGGSGKGDV